MPYEEEDNNNSSGIGQYNTRDIINIIYKISSIPLLACQPHL